MHITLRFVGDIDDRTADEFADLLAGVRARPFQVAIQGVGAFGGRDPRVLWAGVEAGEPLEALYRANERAARAAGLEPDPRLQAACHAGAHARRPPSGRRALPGGERGLRAEPFMATGSCCCRRGRGRAVRPMRSKRSIRSRASRTRHSLFEALLVVAGDQAPEQLRVLVVTSPPAWQFPLPWAGLVRSRSFVRNLCVP